ncbi:unnamed protein product [Allacma fusca]|uniref:Glutathione S-transferase n=1 Tax=Allacma fusca TaxID=39272 RepID=A0A8J2L3Z5_9HEXA|nr:unnamed protein product [Allacma fusca]
MVSCYVGPGTSSSYGHPTYRLIHYVSRGLGEPIRWMFSLADVPFEDVVLWPRDIVPDGVPNVQCSTPLNLVPILEENGRALTQSFAIGRYLAKKFGFIANIPAVDAKGDQLIEAVKDCRLLSRVFIKDKILWSTDEAEVARIDARLDEIFPLYLKLMENMLKNYPGDYMLGNLMTYSDLVLANWLDIWQICLGPELLTPYPTLREHMIRVISHPKIKDIRLIRARSMFSFDYEKYFRSKGIEADDPAE